ncbi:MAG: rod shape-determining protein MreC [Burkholderiales bacterium]
MEHTPPAFFKRGPAPVVRLTFFALLSVALIVLDARFRYAEGLRGALSLATQPLQMIASAPVTALRRVATFFASQSQLSAENAELRAKLLEATLAAQRLEAAAAEGARLKLLMGAADRLPGTAAAAEIIYSGRDPFSRRVLVDKGTNDGVRAGSPVVDESGVVGQVTRVHALLAEVTLLTDKDQAIPVQVARNGLRAVAFGGGTSGMLELRYLAANAEIVSGDRLITSGIDGVYPPGLPVATVTRVERDATNIFARVLCQPAAGVERGRIVLLLTPAAMPLPPAVESAAEKGREKPSAKSRRQRTKDARGP